MVGWGGGCVGCDSEHLVVVYLVSSLSILSIYPPSLIVAAAAFEASDDGGFGEGGWAQPNVKFLIVFCSDFTGFPLICFVI